MPNSDAPPYLWKVIGTVAAGLVLLQNSTDFTIRDAVSGLDVFVANESGATVNNLVIEGTLTVENVTASGATNIKRFVEIPLCLDGEACATGSGATFVIGSEFNNYTISQVSFCSNDAGSAGTMTINIKNAVDNVNVLSTPVTVNNGQRCSTSTGSVVANGTVTTNDVLTPYVTAVHGTPAQGGTLKFTLSPP